MSSQTVSRATASDGTTTGKPPRSERRPTGPAQSVPKLASYVVIGAFALFMLLPFLYMLSIASGHGNNTSLLPHQFALFTNIGNVITSGTFSRFLINSVIMSGGIAVFDVLLSSTAGYALGTLHFPGSRILFWIVVAILGVSPVVVVIPVYVMLRDAHWINTYQALIVPLMCSAFGVFLVRQFALGVPRSVVQAARLDGASEYRIFYRVALPFLRPALITLFLLDFLIQWDNLIWPLIVENKSTMWTVSVGLASFQSEHGVAYNSLSAAALVSMIPPFVLYLLLQRYYVQGMTFGGIER